MKQVHLFCLKPKRVKRNIKNNNTKDVRFCWSWFKDEFEVTTIRKIRNCNRIFGHEWQLYDRIASTTIGLTGVVEQLL